MSIFPESSKNDRRADSEGIILRLNEMMRQRKILPGEPLPAFRDLAKTLGVSPLALGSTFRSLTAVGILRSRQGSGTYVVEADKYPSQESGPLRLLAALHRFTSDERFEARLSLEMSMASLAAERATAEHLTLLMDEILGMFESLDKPQQFFKHHERFHQTIATASNNRILTAVINMVMQIQFDGKCETVLPVKNLQESAEMHRKIFRAIRERNGEAAAGAMRKHLISSQTAWQIRRLRAKGSKSKDQNERELQKRP
jgi:GntR family transcriptional repressor for pyruvate dehydrogenase complex